MGIIEIDSVVITPEMVNLIAEIDEFKGSWQQIGRLMPDRLSSLKRVATIESIGSSTRIEGAKLTDNEVKKLLAELNTHTLETRDEQEVAGYALVCEKVCDHYTEIPFTENMIKQLHMWLLKSVEKDDRHCGEYKKIPIRIEAFDAEGKAIGILFETTSPLETPHQMQELINWTNQTLKKKAIHPLLAIGLFIVLFLAIHPFQDGNGRLSRLLTTLLMLQNSYSYVPYTSLESIIEANKEDYYLALQETQKKWQKGQPNWSAWLLFFLHCLQRQKRHLEVKLEREHILLKEMPLLAQNIISLLSAHGQLTIGNLEKLTQANRNTLKKTLANLVKENYIDKNGKGKATWYTTTIAPLERLE